MLAAMIRASAGTGAQHPPAQRAITLEAEPTRLSGGFWAAIYRFSIDEPGGGLPVGWSGPLVLRVMPERARAEHEIILQRTVADQGFPTPRVLARRLRRVTRRNVHGDAAVGRHITDVGPRARSLFALPRLLRRLPVQLADVAARLHELDPAPVTAALADAGLDVVRWCRYAARRDRRRRDDRQPRLRRTARLVPRHRHRVRPTSSSATVTCTRSTSSSTPTATSPCSTGRTATCCRASSTSGSPRHSCAVRRSVCRSSRRAGSAASPRGWPHRFVTTYERSAPLDAQMVSWFEALQYARCLAEVATARSGLSHVVDDEPSVRGVGRCDDASPDRP